MTAPTLLQQLRHANALRAVDDALARTLQRLDPSTHELVLAAAALASRAVADGHAGFDIAAPRALVDAADIAWPAPGEWQRALEASPWVAIPDAADAETRAAAPLVLEHIGDGTRLLYLRRYREYERRLAADLRRIGRPVSRHPCEGGDPRTLLSPQSDHPLASLFTQLFPHAATHEDQQANAAASALHHSLVLITGGPGTGKTTTITRLLVLLVAQALQSGAAAARIALAAPTGRAAERMAESVRNAVQALAAAGIDDTVLAHLPTAGTTLHRLLGTIPDSARFRHHADNPLPLDTVVVDEASMIDLPLMAKLAEAVADGARLVLLGDPDQLPSVEAGDVLAGILSGIGHLPATHTHLRRGYRQSATLDLAPLAAAVREGDAPTALSLLRAGTLDGVHFHENLTDPLQSHRDHLLAHWSALADATDPVQALALASRLRLLTAVREGPQGARALNARIEALLAERAASAPRRGAPANPDPRYFHGRLLLITENSYRHRLFNGDIGICLRSDAGSASGQETPDASTRDAAGTLMAWFPGDDPLHPRPFHPAALPAHDSAFAMTVHKAQGSEFDAVWLLLPARFNRVLSRELVYTGITRARRELHMAGSGEVIAEALGRHAGRWSGLGWRLGPA